MTSAADIVVKKADGSTDVTYTLLTPSSGDKSPAVWSSNSVGSAVAFRPSFSMQSRWNAAKNARRVDISMSYPQVATNSTTTVTSVVNKSPVTFSIALPSAMPQSDIDEVVAQFTNLLHSSLVVAALKTGYAPT